MIDKEIVKRIKKSKETVGELYPILLDANDQIIDGQHRKEANPDWKTIKLESVKDKKERLIFRLVANHNRKSSNTEALREALADFAQYYSKGFDSGEIGKEIAFKTGIPYRTIMKYLPSEYKRSGGYKFSPRKKEKESKCLEDNSDPLKPNIVETPIDIKDLFEITINVSLPKIQIKSFKNMPWTAIMVETKFMEDLGTRCKRHNIKIDELMARALEYSKEKLE